MTQNNQDKDSVAANQSFGEIELGGEEGNLSLDTNASPKPASDAPPQSFGEVDLGGGGADEDPIPNLGGAPGDGKPKPQKIRRAKLQKGGPPVGEDMDLEKTIPRTSPKPVRKARPRPARPEPEIQLPRRSYKKPILITLLVLVVLGALGGGVYGVMQYMKNAEAEKQAELDQLNQGSLDSMKQQAVNQGQQGL